MSFDESVLAGIMVRFGKTSAAVLLAQQATPAWVATPCASATYTPIPGLRAFHYSSSNSPGSPLLFGWTQSTQATGCGRTLVLNAAVVPGNGVDIQIIHVAPGTTATDPIVGKQIALQIQPFILAQRCNEDYVADTRIVDGGPGKPTWRESWLVNACGKLETADVVLTSNGAATQTTISMQPNTLPLEKT